MADAFFEVIGHAAPEFVAVDFCARDADDFRFRRRLSGLDSPPKGGKQFAHREIAGGAENRQGERSDGNHAARHRLHRDRRSGF